MSEKAGADIPTATPWGIIHEQNTLAEGIVSFTTSDETYGIWLSPERAALIPEVFKSRGQWFAAHDVAINMLALTFRDEVRPEDLESPSEDAWWGVADPKQRLIDKLPDECRSLGFEFKDDESSTLRLRATLAALPHDSRYANAEYAELYCVGVYSVRGPDFSGYYVEPDRMGDIPKVFQEFGPWFVGEASEIVPFIFERDANEYWRTQGLYPDGQNMSGRSLIDSFPNQMRELGYEFEDKESRALRKIAFDTAHANDFIKINHGISHKSLPEIIPEGFVGVRARVGGIDGPGPEASFLVPVIENREPGEFKLVIDPNRHVMLEGDPLEPLIKKYETPTLSRGLTL